MQPSKTGLELTKNFESCRLSAYQDTGGVWTIGWGTTVYPDGSRVKEGDTITQTQADSYLMQAYDAVARIVDRALLVTVTQGEFDALVDFVYNIGVFQFLHSTLLRLLNAGNFQGAALEFDKWDHVNGKEVAGLLRRREAETQEFES